MIDVARSLDLRGSFVEILLHKKCYMQNMQQMKDIAFGCLLILI